MPRDLAAILLGEIDISRASVAPFDGFVFLCGGPLSDSPALNPLRSVRDYAVRKAEVGRNRIANREVIIAERATQLLQAGEFADLLEFESHLAALAACVVIFLESPGAIAELGCFAVMPSLKSKLLVVCEHLHAEPATSFIQLGPIASLRKHNPDSVQVYPMHSGGVVNPVLSAEMVEDCWMDLEQGIDSFAKAAIHGSAFNSATLAHQMVLALELVTLFGALRATELAECIGAFGCGVSSRELGRILKLLNRFALITLRHWGNEKFYVRTDDAQFMKLRRPQGDERPFDRLRFTSDRLTEYERSDTAKIKALKALRKAGGSI